MKYKKIACESLPVLIFFIFYKMIDIYSATFVLIVASLMQISYELIKYKRASIMNYVSCSLVLFFGFFAIYFRYEALIKWKVTIINWLFGVVFIGSSFLEKKPIVQHLMEENVKLSAPIWRVLNIIWGIFFIMLGSVNFFVAHVFSTDVWVNFKLFGMLGITFIFIIGQAAYLAKYHSQKKT